MECNKEEAIRAKEIAEQKMQVKDFVGAKKVAVKAQQLFADLDNISQILTVCEVHCCAGVKVNGEMDWYGILQVGQTADASSIKKHYRKLALLLHPDKNKFAGAEAAFKLIGEAHMVLSDQAKRSVYDIKRRANIPRAVAPKPPAQQPNVTTFPTKQPVVQNNFSGATTFHYGNINLQQTSGTFWTTCPGCSIKFQLARVLLNKPVRCTRCLTTYFAAELNEQTTARPGENPAYPRNLSQNPKQEVPVQANHFGSFHAGGQGNATGGSSSGVNMACGGGVSTSKQKDDGVAGNNIRPRKVNAGVKPSSVNARQKKGRKRVLDSSDSDSSTDCEDAAAEDGIHSEGQNADTGGGHNPRRSCRMKQNVTYNEHGIEDDDDFVGSHKRSKKDEAPHGACLDESLPNGGKSVKKNKANGAEEAHDEKEWTRSDADPAADSESKDSPDIRSFSTPDPEFYDFEQERDASKFAVDQLWAVYDDLDAMPRYYVRIREICSPFRLRFTWLEHTPLTKIQKVWSAEELPVACGNYRLGKSEFIKDLNMFSHIIQWDDGTKRNTYNIHPRKGEIWALFKGWDAGWSLDANSHRLYEYEVVEVLSDVSDGSDFLVVRLVKVQGFVSLFVRSTAIDGSLQIPPAEALRFSHRVPSCRLAGGERDGVPEGSFELDTAALPMDFGETFPSISLESLGTAATARACKLDPGVSDYRSRAGEEKPASFVDKKATDSSEGINGLFHNANAKTAPSPSASSYEYPETEFHSFQEDKSIEKFQSGQIWALYNEIDGQPKYYAKIKKVNVNSIEIHVRWAELLPQRKDETEWRRKKLPATCGRFKVQGKPTPFGSTEAFSHLVHAEPVTGKGELYDIYPKTGEVWALYKDWSTGWTSSTLGDCKCQVVEILEVADSAVKVLPLIKIADYNSVFMPERKGDVEFVMKIPLAENLRFSHQIPAFRLTNELGGALQGYWELDSASVPHI